MNIIIRNELEKDYRRVEQITREAFWNLYFPGCNEHYLAHVMRNHADFIKELDFVAEYDGKVVGNIMYTKAWLIGDNEELDIISFGPVSVVPELQRKGIGSALIQRSLADARQDGAKAIVIFGDPHNYCKHGFKTAKDLNISDMNGEYPSAMLALELQKGALQGRSWKFKYSSVCDINPQEAEAFDKTFEPKVKEYQYSQEIFSIHCRSFIK